MSENLRKIFNPDFYLGFPRVWSVERGKEAWEKTYADLEDSLKKLGSSATVYIVCGMPGSGKSTWISRNEHEFKLPALVLDAALPGARHRKRSVELAKKYGAKIEVIWINVPLEKALMWNRLRPVDEQIPDETIKYVCENFEAPSIDEGYSKVREVVQ
ncbi:AAA family ATPase [Pandoraea anhela]|uniref:AAA family ATPase n=1 Tax=Pandoraea anhela TaxID=2508295 RepID=UPI00123F85F9|nr:AAA family ATPase [Pandoraea anhela]